MQLPLGWRAGAVGPGWDRRRKREQIVALAARYAVPTIYEWREFAAAGGLITVRVVAPRRVFPTLIPGAAHSRTVRRAYYLQRTERKLRRPQLTERGTLEVSGRDLR